MTTRPASGEQLLVAFLAAVWLAFAAISLLCSLSDPDKR